MSVSFLCDMVSTINPFTAPACKISGLKDARKHLQTVYFPVLWRCATCFDENPFTYNYASAKKENKILQVSDFVVLLVVFKWQ